jgi:hypothetical protein
MIPALTAAPPAPPLPPPLPPVPKPGLLGQLAVPKSTAGGLPTRECVQVDPCERIQCISWSQSWEQVPVDMKDAWEK